ncbi:hypothetical protein GWI33_014800 [Rhynchophorus ferrugineus]|uniref:ethanolamine-phosphate cytidylyltransferase n=1 Tax=Rhynchophorus ferrugineus TaxID=354439 RepID=A0A834M6J7_RHYFE|nr:hypothetical protein GWI33_014800 [Rhynchophorus ferrugineus]
MQTHQKNSGTRLWCDGCYDLVHFGHANFLRQAKALGGYLIVGLHSDEEIKNHKRQPVYTEEERLKMVRAIKWVDEVVEDVPYITTLDTMDKHNCDVCVHADDITVTADGQDTYHLVKNAGRYREVLRTCGISTTDLVGRILKLSKNHEDSDTINQIPSERSPWTGFNQFLPTALKIWNFSDGIPPKKGDKIVYVDGAFDLLHAGHVDFLEKVHQQADYVLVGLHSDEVIKKYKGTQYPVMNLFERTMNVLACKYVSDVIIDAPYKVTQQLMDEFKIDLVIHGQTPIMKMKDEEDPYKVPIALGKFKSINSGNSTTTEEIIQRVIKNYQEFKNRNQKKEEMELELIRKLNTTATNPAMKKSEFFL